jgi:parvulin-like peptidyl-prolyl isomerase
MVEEFEEVIDALAPGEVSEIFETPFGFHLARLDDRRPERSKDLEEVRDEITRELLETNRDGAFKDFLNGLREKAEITEE